MSDEQVSMSELVRMLWQDLMDKDDRNSPAEYPDHCLITFDELRRYIATALESSATSLQQAVEAERAECSALLLHMRDADTGNSPQASGRRTAFERAAREIRARSKG